MATKTKDRKRRSSSLKRSIEETSDVSKNQGKDISNKKKSLKLAVSASTYSNTRTSAESDNDEEFSTPCGPCEEEDVDNYLGERIIPKRKDDISNMIIECNNAKMTKVESNGTETEQNIQLMLKISMPAIQSSNQTSDPSPNAFEDKNSDTCDRLREENRKLKQTIKDLENKLGQEEQQKQNLACTSKPSTPSLNERAKKSAPKNLKRGEKMQNRQNLQCVIPSPIYNDERLKRLFPALQERISTKDYQVLVVSKDPADIQKGDKVCIPCINSSRVGSDANVAFTSAHLPADCPVILLIFNHLASHNSQISTPTQDRLNDQAITSRCIAIIDLVFWQKKMYDCDVNTRGCEQILQQLIN